MTFAQGIPRTISTGPQRVYTVGGIYYDYRPLLYYYYTVRFNRIFYFCIFLAGNL